MSWNTGIYTQKPFNPKLPNGPMYFKPSKLQLPLDLSEYCLQLASKFYKQARLHLQALSVEIGQTPMVPKGPNNTQNTKVKNNVKDQIFSHRIWLWWKGEGKKNKNDLALGFKYLSNSTIRVSSLLKIVGIWCTCSGYGKGTLGNPTN